MKIQINAKGFKLTMLFFQFLMKKIKSYQHYNIRHWVCLLILVINCPVYANIVLNEITSYKDQGLTFNWESIISHPQHENHFYIYNVQGVVTEMVNGQLSTSPIINLSTVFAQSDIKLTTISLHPNFHLKDLPGYQTFYTAHQEPINSNNEQFRIDELTENSRYDLVVNEWRLNNDTFIADLTTQREIIRIASPEKNNTIKQIAFNPYLKPWQDGFGSLYIVLNHAEGYKDTPLYSGALLHIHPQKFGLRNYTVPEKNPFKRNSNIPNEIIAYNLNNITNILWNKTDNTQWFYTEVSAKETLLKKVKIGQTSEAKREKIIWNNQSTNNKPSIVWYEGSKLTNIIYQFIILEFISEQWQLSSVDVNKNTTIEKTILAPISNDNKQTQLRLIVNNKKELLLLNLTKKTISEIKQIGKSQANQSNNNNIPQLKTKLKNHLLWLLVIALVLLFIFVVIIKLRNFDQEKSLVRKLYAKFNFIHNNEAIELYKRHKAQPQETLQVSQIQSVNILLNNEIINTVDNEDNAFTEQAKKRMLQTISLEHRLKMVDNRKRIIIVEFVINKNIKHQLSLYVRRGNQRYTRTGYQESLIMLVHLCNTISEKINQHE